MIQAKPITLIFMHLLAKLQYGQVSRPFLGIFLWSDIHDAEISPSILKMSSYSIL